MCETLDEIHDMQLAAIIEDEKAGTKRGKADTRSGMIPPNFCSKSVPVV